MTRAVALVDELARQRTPVGIAELARSLDLAKSTVAKVKDLTGEKPHGMVVLGTAGPRQRTSKEFMAYAPFVSVGSYVVVEDTMLNGHPVWPEYGPGPWEAVKQLLNRRSDFVADPFMERFALTFNPGGFLKRMR